MTIRRVSIEPSRHCSKACAFCYNGSGPEAGGEWSAADVIAFGRDLAANGALSLSFGGGEPLEWEGVFDALGALDGHLLRSLTTNGLPLLEPKVFGRLVAARPDKCHVSVHNPGSASEIRRVIETVKTLEARGVRSGVNLVVARARLEQARGAAAMLREGGIENDRIVYLPMRGADTPTPSEVASIAGGPFQSMTCLRACGRSERFVSVAADRTVAWCSYTRSRRRLEALTYRAVATALEGLELEPCDGALVRPSRLADRRPSVEADQR